ncbi:MAG: sulfite exporter TauE/SafE family protein [Phycisphaerales bacterium]|nr:sulfite exporter TauE/SafE family protein [Phycisphaerales bacterium]
MWYSILAGLGIGLIGSFHCIGMCGPIALSLPIYGKSKIEKLLLIILYNIGRACSYASLGLLFGYIGNQFFLFGYQRAFSISLGFLLLIFLFAHQFLSARFAIIDKIFNRVKSVLAKGLQSTQSSYSYFLIGVANGFLPCGLVYLAIGSAMATGNMLYGAALMFVFGMGTFPLMISLMIFGRFISLTFRNRMRKITPAFIVLTALVIILRGMNLGIPYLSPQLQENNAVEQVKCHK